MNKLHERLKEYVQEKNKCFVGEGNLDKIFVSKNELSCYERKTEQLTKRGSTIVRSVVDGKIIATHHDEKNADLEYLLHYQQLIRNNKKFYLEEQIQHNSL